MMDAAYFVGRNEILAWVNSTLHLALSKVEEVGSRNPLNPYEFSLTSLVNCNVEGDKFEMLINS
jgi:hypothetical protein